MSENNQISHSRRRKRNRDIVIGIVLAAFAVTIGGLYYITKNYIPASPSDHIQSTTTTKAATTTQPPVTEPDLSTPNLKIQFAGDVLLHSKPVSGAKTGENTYDFNPYFTQIKDYVDGDLSICNMEGPVDSYGNNQKISYYPQFNSPYEILEGIKNMGFNFVTTANNHTFDQHLEGLINTRNNVIKSGLDFTGTNETQEQHDTYFIKEYNGIKVGVIAYSALDNGLSGVIPKDARKYVMRMFSSSPDSPDILKMINEIQACKSAGAEFVIVSLHWGVEYVDTPPDGFQKIARQLCDGGADIIMGNHSHCVQPIEKYTATRAEGKKETLIIYSLGNFFADQIALNMGKTQYGMIVNVNIHKNKQGEIEFGECNYVPTLTYRYQKSNGTYGFYLLPAGKMMDAQERPEVFQTDADWQKAKKAWEHVTKVVGDDIPASK